MLDTLDLKLSLDKKEYKKIKDERMERLGALQRAIRDAKIPVVIIFEGWNSSGKGVLINSLVQAMDPRGFKVHTSYQAREEERSKPFFWQFWTKLPAKGNLAIFDRGWYFQTVHREVCGHASAMESAIAYGDINAFERLLTDDNHIIIKFFTHISAKEHKKRIKELEKNFGKDWRPTDEDWREIKIYEPLLAIYEEMFSKTDTAHAPWVAVEAHDTKYAQIKVLDHVINVLEKKLEEVETAKKETVQCKKEKTQNPLPENAFHSSVLNKVKLDQDVTEKEYEEKMDKYQERLQELQFKLFRSKMPMILVFEGWDAAGKGGTIKRVTAHMDPRGYYVTPVAAPGLVDRDYHYLWRFWKEMPPKGMVAIFDRSWYGRVMVERVEGFATEDQWRRAYKEINEMEEQLTNSGNILLKFWLQIDKEEQLRRFEDRQSTPAKNWKITEEDWRNREKWDEYEVAVNEMLFRTSTTHAPWTIVESNCKFYGRLKTIKTIVNHIESHFK